MARKGRRDRGLFEYPKRSGIWWIRYYDGDHHEHSEKGGNKSEARALLERRKSEVALGTWQPSAKANRGKWLELREHAREARPTLGVFALRWLEERAPHLTPAVVDDYSSLLKIHLLSHSLAQRPLDSIDDGHVMRLVNHVRAQAGYRGKPLSNRRVNMVIARLRTIFATAHRRKLISDNPMQYVENLREPKSEVDPFDLEEARRIVTAAQGWERAFLSVLLFTGLRPNEALALPWEAIDWKHNLIRVRRTLNRRYGFGLPKTPGSEREVEIISQVRMELEQQRSRSQLKSELVFPSEAGTPIDLVNFRQRNWPRILQRARVRPRVLYQCRHTFARLAIEAGDTPQHVAAMLGHTTVEMVFRVYGRWLERPESVALARLDAALREPGPGAVGPGLVGKSSPKRENLVHRRIELTARPAR
jgi:integrase